MILGLFRCTRIKNLIVLATVQLHIVNIKIFGQNIYMAISTDPDQTAPIYSLIPHFPLKTIPKNLDLSIKTDLNFWNYYVRENPIL